MAKKNPGQKSTAKSAAKARKPAPKVAAAKKSPKKAVKVPVGKQPSAKVGGVKKPVAGVAGQSTTKPPAKGNAVPAPTKGVASGKGAATSAATSAAKPEVKSVGAPVMSGSPAADAGDAGGEGGDNRNKPKGITIVQNRPMKKPKIKKPVEMPKLGEPLLKPGSKTKWKPLIPSGPKAPNPNATLSHAGGDAKSKMPKKEMDRYHAMLLRKRAELVGDVSTMEDEALKGSSGSLSHLPQHMADQGTETFDQALSLDLAQVDRNLIREIDDALARIEKGTYGVCELTGKIISKERLDELPWTRYSIEAARDLERRGVRS